MKVLVVEDDHFLLNAYRVKFGDLGYEVKMAANGNEAWTVISKWKPDVVVLDIMLPEVDGLEFLEKIKKDDGLKDIPVLVASNLGQNEDIEKAMKLGAAGYVIKGDLTLNELIGKLNDLIKK